MQIGAYYRPDSTELYSQEYIIKAHSCVNILQRNSDATQIQTGHRMPQKLMSVKLKLTTHISVGRSQHMHSLQQTFFDMSTMREKSTTRLQ